MNRGKFLWLVVIVFTLVIWVGIYRSFGESRIQARGLEVSGAPVLRIGVRMESPPYSFEYSSIRYQNTLYRGFDVELGRELSERWTGDRYLYQIIPLALDDRIPALEDGRVDILIAGLSRTNERCDSEKIDCNEERTYMNDTTALLVRDDAAINSFCDLQGKGKLAVLKGSITEEIVQNGTINILCDGVSIPIPIVDPYQKRIAAVNAVRAGDAIGYITDGEILNCYAEQFPELELITNSQEDRQLLVIVTRTDDSDLRQMINNTLQQMNDDETYQVLHENFFGTKEIHRIVKDTDFKPLDRSKDVYPTMPLGSENGVYERCGVL